MNDNVTSSLARKFLNTLSELQVITPDTRQFPGGVLYTMEDANDWVQSLISIKRMQGHYGQVHSKKIDGVVRT